MSCLRPTVHESSCELRNCSVPAGASDAVSNAYDTVRGKGSFGQLADASCGYTERPDDYMPFPRDAVAATGDSNEDYAGL